MRCAVSIGEAHGDDGHVRIPWRHGRPSRRLGGHHPVLREEHRGRPQRLGGALRDGQRIPGLHAARAGAVAISPRAQRRRQHAGILLGEAVLQHLGHRYPHAGLRRLRVAAVLPRPPLRRHAPHLRRPVGLLHRHRRADRRPVQWQRRPPPHGDRAGRAFQLLQRHPDPAEGLPRAAVLAGAPGPGPVVHGGRDRLHLPRVARGNAGGSGSAETQLG
mmetsp:Transcript_88039/g.269347  ORF Transcript_88039/g.269347 Transcript_88039/m.269347 type:complete len:217 (+) Transcript_88039:1665-2315(+)